MRTRSLFRREGIQVQKSDRRFCAGRTDPGVVLVRTGECCKMPLLRWPHGSRRLQAEQAGTRLDFVTGSIEAVAGGRVRRAAGVFQVDEDGTPHIFVQADSRARAPEQLYRHELYHSIVKQNRGLWQQIVEHLNRNYTQEEIASIVGSYIDAFDGCYGYGEADVEAYLEEIFADVYADMDRGGGRERASREAVQPVAQRFAGDIENARQNRAGIERRNGPGTRFSKDEYDQHTPEERIIMREYEDAVDQKLLSFIHRVRGLKSDSYRAKQIYPLTAMTERQAADIQRILGQNA